MSNIIDPMDRDIILTVLFVLFVAYGIMKELAGENVLPKL